MNVNTSNCFGVLKMVVSRMRVSVNGSWKMDVSDNSMQFNAIRSLSAFNAYIITHILAEELNHLPHFTVLSFRYDSERNGFSERETC